MSASVNRLSASTLNLDTTTPKQTSVKAKPKEQHKKPTWAKARANSKVRMKLPSIEAYQKELEFQADAPSRVVVRLERLMGTDKIRITDPVYMRTLLERIQQEEEASWLKRTRDRKQAEKNRFRQLAIEGKANPTPDMQDLYNHPVFRVNRILNRLTKLDMDYSITDTKLPPITPVEPFADGINYNYPGSENVFHDERSMEESEGEGQQSKTTTAEPSAESNQSTKSDEKPGTQIVPNDEDREDDIEWEGESQYYPKAGGEKSDSLTAYMKAYNIPMTADIEKKCKPFHSPLIDLVYDEDLSGAKEMYDMANEILGAYKRENMVADDFTVKLGKML